MFNKLIFSIIIIQVQSHAIGSKDECIIDVTKYDPQPIVSDVDTHTFLYPKYEENEPIIRIEPGKSVHIASPASVISIGSKNYTFIKAVCVSGQVFTVATDQIDIGTLAVLGNPRNTARYTETTACEPYQEIEVGFSISDDIFVRQYTTCFNANTQSSVYAVAIIPESIGHRQVSVPRPAFVQDNFYEIGSINRLYTKNVQRQTINKLIGLPEDSDKYIKKTGDYYLARGHYSARADYIYATQNNATFHYINAAPQWQTFNAGNWATVEDDVRAYAEKQRYELIIYTGTYGVATLPHEETGEDTPLYLYVDEDKSALIVPELFWKIVYEPSSKLGVAILGVNNPYLEDVQKSIICEDVAEKIEWLTWEKDDLKNGYGYVCAVDDVRATIDFLPEFQVDGLLI